MRTVLKKLRKSTKMMSLREIAAMYNVTTVTVRRWINLDYLPAIQVGGLIVCPTTDVKTVRDRIPLPGRRPGFQQTRRAR